MSEQISLETLKITDKEITDNGVSAVPDKLTGTAGENKAVFDKLVKNVVKTAINEIIETLVSKNGASSIGAADTDDTKSTVQSLISSLFAKTDETNENIAAIQTLLTSLTSSEGALSIGAVDEDENTSNVQALLSSLFESGNEIKQSIADLEALLKSENGASSIGATDKDQTASTVQFLISSLFAKTDETNENIAAIQTLLTSLTSSEGASSVGAVDANDSGSNVQTLLSSLFTECNEIREQIEALQSLIESLGGNSSGGGLTPSQKTQLEQNTKDIESIKEHYEIFAQRIDDNVGSICDLEANLNENYVKNTDLVQANVDKAGLVRPPEPSYGIYLKNDKFAVWSGGEKRESIVSAKTSTYIPLTPSSIDLAVKVGLTTNNLDLTNDEKTAVANWLGLGGATIKTGSWSGTGTSITLTFDIEPKMIIVWGTDYDQSGGTIGFIALVPMNQDRGAGWCFPVNGQQVLLVTNVADNWSPSIKQVFFNISAAVSNYSSRYCSYIAIF